MGLFSAIVKTAIESAKLPISMAKDAVSLGNAAGDESYTKQRLRIIEQAAEDTDAKELDKEESLIP